jgi:hypothetical protein
MAHVHERAELVDREEVPHAVAELLGDVGSVVPECLGRVPVLPSALVLERLRQIPVVERGERRDARRDQLVHQPVVKVEAFRVRRARALREDARPGG